MSKLDMFQITVRPWEYKGFNGGVERLYEIRVRVNGEDVTTTKVAPEIPPQMTEIEVLTRMARDIIYELDKKYTEGQDGTNRNKS